MNNNNVLSAIEASLRAHAIVNSFSLMFFPLSLSRLIEMN